MIKIILSIKAMPYSSEEKIEWNAAQNMLIVHFKATPEKGLANKKLLKILAKKFNIPQSDICIKSGFTQAKKLIELHFANEEDYIQKKILLYTNK